MLFFKEDVSSCTMKIYMLYFPSLNNTIAYANEYVKHTPVLVQYVYNRLNATCLSTIDYSTGAILHFKQSLINRLFRICKPVAFIREIFVL